MYFKKYFWLLCKDFGILDPQPGIRPGSSAVRSKNLSHWTAREFQK